MSPRVLHVLSQRPEMTGSGTTVDALVREAERRGWQQHVVCGLPAGEPAPPVGDLAPERVLPLRFGAGGQLPFAVPGMSDVMPYPSTVWSSLGREQLDRYRAAWRVHLRRAIETAQPDLLHVHHAWVLAALVRDVAPRVPSVLHCHGSDLRQFELCPHLVNDVVQGNRRHDRFLALHRAQAATLAARLAVPLERVAVVGAGYRDDVFHPGAGDDRAGHVLFAGKLAAAKGLPWLLDAVARLAGEHARVTLHVAGEGHGAEAAGLRARMEALGRVVAWHGRLDPPALADLMRRCAVLVLPSLSEGLPLVLIEARACGCRLVATDLPGLRERFAPALGDDLALVPPPRVVRGDQPVREDRAPFVARLAAALDAALRAEPVDPDPTPLTPFTWRAVFARVEREWERLLG